MRRTLLAALALGLVAAAAPAAHANPFYHYRGGCGVTMANDATPGAWLGGPSVWVGEADVVAIATNHAFGTPAPTAAISVRCDLYVNGNFNGTIATGAGTGVALNVTPQTWFLPAGAWVDICETVVVQGEFHFSCFAVTTVQPVPQPVYDAADAVLFALDPALCPLIGAAAPGIPGTLDIHPWGDVYVLGHQVYDCPPYNGGPRIEPQHLMVLRKF